MKKEPAKTHQERRIRRSGASGGRAPDGWGFAHVRDRGWRSGPVASIPTQYPWVIATVPSY